MEHSTWPSTDKKPNTSCRWGNALGRPSIKWIVQECNLQRRACVITGLIYECSDTVEQRVTSWRQQRREADRHVTVIYAKYSSIPRFLHARLSCMDSQMPWYIFSFLWQKAFYLSTIKLTKQWYRPCTACIYGRTQNNAWNCIANQLNPKQKQLQKGNNRQYYRNWGTF